MPNLSLRNKHRTPCRQKSLLLNAVQSVVTALNHESRNVHRAELRAEQSIPPLLSSLPDLPDLVTLSCQEGPHAAGCPWQCLCGCCSPPVISYLCLRLRQPASSPATSQPTSTSLLLGQRLPRGYLFCFSHLLSLLLLSLSLSYSLALFLFHSLLCACAHRYVCLPFSSSCLSLSRLSLSHSVCLSLFLLFCLSSLISSDRGWTCCSDATF